jgi:hypothetical protein
MRRELLADNTLRILARRSGKDEGIVQAVTKVADLLSPRLHHLEFPDPQGSGNTDASQNARECITRALSQARSVRLSEYQISRFEHDC